MDMREEKRKISLKCELNDNELTIEVHDDGVGIDDIERAMEPMYTSKPQLERSGMGFFIYGGIYG